MQSSKESRDEAFTATLTVITVTSAEDRIMETLISDEITKHLEKRELIQSCQQSLIKGKSCLTNLLEFFKEVTQTPDRKKT